MPVTNPGTPTVAVSVPVPTPVQPKRQPRSTLAKPHAARIPKEEEARGPQLQPFTPPPRPQLRAVILPWTPSMRRMERVKSPTVGPIHYDRKGLTANEKKRAQKVDLVVLPEGTSGTNCGNCKFVINKDKGLYCNNSRVRLPVTKKHCCALWDRKGTKHVGGPSKLKRMVIMFARNHVGGTTYEAANRFLGNRDQRRLAANKIIHRDNQNNIHVRLHGTNVVTYHPDGGITVNTGGYLTPTTMATIKDYTGLGTSRAGGQFSIRLPSGEWHNVEDNRTHHIPPPGKQQQPVSTGEAIWKAVTNEPLEATPHGAYADYLEESGAPQEDINFHRTIYDLKNRGLIRQYDPERVGFQFGIYYRDLPKELKDVSRNSFVSSRDSPEPGISNDEILWHNHEHMMERMRQAYRSPKPEQLSRRRVLQKLRSKNA